MRFQSVWSIRIFTIFTLLCTTLLVGNALAFTLPENFTDQAVLQNLQDTDGFAFSPDGRLFISERITGKLRVAKYNGATDSWSLNAQPFYTFDTPKNGAGQPEARRSGGLRDIAFDPNFSSNGYVYAFYMANGSLHNRVVRIQASAADPDLANSAETLLIDLPFNSSASSGSHNGGALEFGGDDKLYITTGDGWEGANAGDAVQSLTTYTGKVLRINPDGTIPNDNPFFLETTGNYRAIYALGLRNPYSMSKHPDTDVLYINEARGTNKDSIYIVESRANYRHEGTGIGNARDPWANASATAGSTTGELITGGAWLPELGSGSFPAEYNGNYFAVLWGGNSTPSGHINVLSSDDPDPTVSGFASGLGLAGSNGIRVKPVIGRFHASGDLYYMLTTYTTSSAQIRRIQYTALETVATPVFSPNGGNSATDITLSISTATSSAEIRYTLDNTAPSQTSLLYTTPIVLSSSTVVRARAFKDNFNSSSEASAVFVIGDTSNNQPPNVNAGANKIGFLGQSISLDGSGTTDPDGSDDFLTGEQWTQLAGPPVTILDATEEIAFFTPTQLATYRFRLEVSDGVDVGSDEVTIAIIRPARVDAGLQVLYTFAEGSGSLVNDVSNVGSALDLSIANPGAVNWLQGGGLDIVTATSLNSSTATKLIDSCKASNAITIEAWTLTDSVSQTGPARIVSFSTDTLNRNFTLGQDSDRYDVRLRTTATDNNGTPSLAVPASTVNESLTHTVYTRTAAGSASIHINGIQQVVGTVGGNLSNWDAAYSLILGNEATGDRHWLGELHLVAIFCAALDADGIAQNLAAGLAPFNSPPDQDGDGVIDVIDNCPAVSNVSQLDSDGDNVGDACKSSTNQSTDDACFVLPTSNGVVASFCL